MKTDYIIIGAGSSGAVVAKRLSENPNNNVLLLEAGGKPNFLSTIPGMYSLINRSKLDWAFSTEPQKNVNNRQIFLPRGKVLGGCSSTNAMAYVRGNAEDYNDWAAKGNESWDYKSVLPYFKKSENNHAYQNDFHGTEGELHVTKREKYHDSSYAFINACKENGMGYVEDYNGEKQEGVSFLQYTIHNNVRQSTFQSFLKPILSRKNLQIKTGATVKKILIEKGKSVGVEIHTGKNSSEKIFAEKEIILCAGAFQSPQILKVSGIGPKEELQKFGIEVLYENNAVGENLKDHVWTPTSELSTIPGLNQIVKKHIFVGSLLNYWRKKESLLNYSLIETNAFYKSSEAEKIPDLQMHIAPVHMGNEYKVDMYNPFSFPKSNGFSILSILLHPESVGNVGLNSKDSRVAPKIQPNFLSAENDFKKLIIGLRKSMEIIDSESFDKIRFGKKMNYPNINSSDDELTQHIYKTLETLYHPIGTCRMGNGKNSVVNSRLQVHDIENLRVADASIMPEIITGNTNAACIMIGEKCAAMILEDEKN